jgi:aminopeptidase N
MQLLLLTITLLLITACRLTSPASSPTPSLPPTATPLPAPTDTAPGPGFAVDPSALPEAPRYDIDLTIDPNGTQVTGHQRIGYTNAETEPLDEIVIRLFPNTPGYGGAMTVDRVQLNGTPVSPTAELENSALRLPLAPPLAPGERVTITLDFTVTVPTALNTGYAQLSTVNGVTALANVYPLIPVYDDEGWNAELAVPYGDAVTSDVAFYTVDVATSSTLDLVASGSCTMPEPGAWECTAGPMRDFVLVLGPDYQRITQEVDGTLVNGYHYPDHAESGEWVLEIAADAFAVFSDLFGAYPYAEFDVVETPTSAGGIEYPGLVVISDRLYGGQGEYAEWVVVHEVAHQWWYGLVGNDQVDEPWLDEALTQYSSLLYFETAYGADTAADIVETNFEQAHQRLIDSGNDMPVGLPVAAYSPALYSPVVYQKGPLYFHALREMVGDEAFLAILRTYFNRNRYEVATPEEFLTVVKIVTGDEHRSLYEQWIIGTQGK